MTWSQPPCRTQASQPSLFTALLQVKVVFYKHCDAESAGLALEALEAEDGDTSAVLCARPRRRRRFLVTEAVFPSSGRLAPLPELVELRARFKVGPSRGPGMGDGEEERAAPPSDERNHAPRLGLLVTRAFVFWFGICA